MLKLYAQGEIGGHGDQGGAMPHCLLVSHSRRVTEWEADLREDLAAAPLAPAP